MQNIPTKSTGDTLQATEFNDIPDELENVITDTGIALTGADVSQVSKAISNYVAGGSFYTDSGTSTAYVLTAIGSKKAPTAYVNGMTVNFVATNINTDSAPTINVGGLGVKNIVVNTGTPIEIGDITTEIVTTLVFDSVNDEFVYSGVFLSRRPKSYKTVASMVADLGLQVGQRVELTGYTTDGDGGGKRGTVVAPATGTDDGGSIHDLDNGNQFQMTIEGVITPQQWGAIGDDAANDTLACKNANLSSASHIFYPSGSYYCPDETIPFESDKTYSGVFQQSQIRSDTDNQPIAASRAFLTADGVVAPAGRCVIRELQFRGEQTNTDQKCLVIHDFLTTLDRVKVVDGGSGGIQFTKANEDATDAGGSLVENRLEGCIARNCGGTLFDLGESGNGKLTDGFMNDCTADGLDTLTTGHIFIGQSAGWIVDGCHLYGSTSSTAIDAVAANNTKIINFYIESFERFGVSVGDAQSNVEISGSIKGNNIDDSGGDVRYVNVGRSGIVDDVTVNVDIQINHANSLVDASAVRYAGTGISGRCNIGIQNDDNSTLTELGEASTGDADSVSTPYNFKLSDDNQTGQLTNGFAFPIAYSSGRLSGNGAQSVTFELPTVSGSQKISLDVNIHAGSLDLGGTVLATYRSFVMVTGKVAADKELLVTDVVAAGGAPGFSSAPVLSLNDASTDTPELQIDFTFSSANSTGAVTAICVPARVSFQ